MELHHLARMIEWLDEERRKDKAIIATLEQRMAQQAETITALQRRVSGLESDQSVLREQALPAQRERGLIEQTRTEMRALLEQNEARRLTAERESERRYDLNREAIMTHIRELTEQVDRLQRTLVTVSEVRSETTRINEIISVLQQRLEEINKKLIDPDRRLALVEETLRQDSRRLSELETEIPEVKRAVESLRPKMALIEDISLRNERRIQDLQNTERDRREQLQQFVEQQSLIVQQQEQRMEALIKRFTEYETELQKSFDRFEMWSQTYRDMKRIIDDFDRIGERLERRINEVAEMQRLSEERFRAEWNTWRDEDQKQRRQQTLTNDEIWRSHDREFEQYVKRLADIETILPPLADSLKRIWQLERERAALYRDRYQQLLHEYDTMSAGNISSLSGGSNGSSG